MSHLSLSSSAASDHLNLVLALPVPNPDPDEINLDLILAPPPIRSPFDNNQWDIIKTLTDSDVGNHSRLLISKNKAGNILKELSIEEKKQVYTDNGLRIKVLDIDMNREVFLNLKVLSSNQAHILNGKWRSGFVNARDLKKDNVIGLRYWRQPRDTAGMLLFKVLNKN